MHLLKKNMDVTCSRTARLRFFVFVCLVLLTTTVGCRSSREYRQKADEQVYSIISGKSQFVPGMEPEFQLSGTEGYSSPADLGVDEGGTVTVGLAGAVDIAKRYNRNYQARKEDVYIETLALTLERHLWEPRFSGGVGGFLTREADQTVLDLDAGFGLDWALATGADLSLSLSSAFLRYLSGGADAGAASLIEATIRQPLWRGAGRRVAQESLVQAERRAIYEMRSFVRYQREFYVSVAANFYRILQQQDVLINERMNLSNLTSARERAEMLAEAGRMPEFQVDQTRQNELRARDRWIRAQQQYEAMLDDFKVELGLPTGISLELDKSELDDLRDMIEDDSALLPREKAIGLAIQNRLDLAIAHDRIGDSVRQIAVAESLLRPSFDFIASARTGTQGDTSFLKFTDERRRLSAGLDLELPLDRLAERNNYRRALINYDRRQRDYDLLRDRVVQQVRDAWRNSEEAKTSYDIQRMSVELAQQRASSATLLIEAGRAEMRDLLEAQEALVEARNQLTSRLIDYRVALLTLWRDMGVLIFSQDSFDMAIPEMLEPGSP